MPLNIENDGVYANGSDIRQVRDMYTASSRAIVMVRYRVLAGEPSADPAVGHRGYQGYHSCKLAQFRKWAGERLEVESPTVQWLIGKPVISADKLMLGHAYWQGDEHLLCLTGLLLDEKGEVEIRFRKLTADGLQSGHNFYSPADEFFESRTLEAKFEAHALKNWNKNALK